MTCHDCGQEIQSLHGVAYRIAGWEQERDAGGTNHVLWRIRTGEVICPDCVTRRKYGRNPNQETLIQ